MANIRKTNSALSKAETNPPKLLCTKQVARIANLSPSFFEKARGKGRTDGPPWFKIGGSARYREDEFYEWLETRRVTGGQAND